MTRVAIIPARGGSKRIPRKNIKDFCGAPMISYSIKAAIEAGCFDRVIVSTDDQEIAAIARSYGAEVPFIRPQQLSDDHATTMDVLVHAVDALGLAGDSILVCIYATAPLVLSTDISESVHELSSGDDDFVVSVCEFSYPIDRSLVVRNNLLSMKSPENMNTRSQDLEPAYHDAGQFYACKVSAINSGKYFFTESKCKPKVLPSYRVQDIDTPDDWIRAEALFKVLNAN